MHAGRLIYKSPRSVLSTVCVIAWLLSALGAAGQETQPPETSLAAHPEALKLLQRKILDVLYPEQLEQFVSGVDPSEIQLANGETLEEFIERTRQTRAAGLVFQPLDPCVLLDTSKTGDRFVAGESRTLLLRGPKTDYSASGGAADGCGLPGLVGDVFKTNLARAAFVTVEIRDPAAAGRLLVWQGQEQMGPSIGLVRYGPGHLGTTSAIVSLCDQESPAPCVDGDLAMQALDAGTDVVLTLLGYFQPASSAASAFQAADSARTQKSTASPFWEPGNAPGDIQYSDGQVGIGITDPQATFHVVGSEESYPYNKAVKIRARGESPTYRDHLQIVGDLESGYGLAFGGQGHHRGGLYAKNVGGTSSSTGEITLWSRGGGNLLLKGGNVGIGTAEPEVKLDVVGNTRIKSSYLGLFNTHSSYPEGLHDARFQQWERLSLALRSAGNAFSIEKWDATQRLATIAHFDRDTRNVGLGTRSPATPLSILGHGGQHQVGMTQNQVGGDATMELTTADASGSQATRLLLRGASDSADIELYRGGRGAETLSFLVSGSSGNVGIGAATPLSPLSIRANGGTDQVGITQNQVGGVSTMELTTADSSGSQATRLLLRGGGDAGKIEFYRGRRGAEALSMLVDGTTGRVGIGTSSPDAELDVVGDIKLSGNLVSEGDICIGSCS